MADYILIDNERLKVMKAVGSLLAAEYWTEILCRNTDTTIDDRNTKRFLSKYTDMELRMLYYNHTGEVISPQTEYGDTLRQVYERVILPLEMDETPVEVLQDILGRDVREDPKPVVPAPDNSTTKAASTPKRTATGSKGVGSGGSTGGPPKGGTTARVWAIANEVYDKNEGEEIDVKDLRTQIIAKCESEGINKSTAGTQYSKWKKDKGL